MGSVPPKGLSFQVLVLVFSFSDWFAALSGWVNASMDQIADALRSNTVQKSSAHPADPAMLCDGFPRWANSNYGTAAVGYLWRGPGVRAEQETAPGERRGGTNAPSKPCHCSYQPALSSQAHS